MANLLFKSAFRALMLGLAVPPVLVGTTLLLPPELQSALTVRLEETPTVAKLSPQPAAARPPAPAVKNRTADTTPPTASLTPGAVPAWTVSTPLPVAPVPAPIDPEPVAPVRPASPPERERPADWEVTARLASEERLAARFEGQISGLKESFDRMAMAQNERRMSDLERATLHAVERAQQQQQQLQQQIDQLKQLPAAAGPLPQLTTTPGRPGSGPAAAAAAPNDGTPPLVQPIIQPALEPGGSRPPLLSGTNPAADAPTTPPAPVPATLAPPAPSPANQVLRITPSTSPPLVLDDLPPLPDQATGPAPAGPPERFNLQVQNAELDRVLDMLGKLSGTNILSSPSVTGKVTINLQDVTLDRALEALLRARGFVYERDEEFVYVYTQAEMEARRLSLRKVVSKIYKPHYINAKELVQLITPVLTPMIGKTGVTTPSPTGIAESTDTTGGDGLAQQDALMVQDYAEVLAEVDRIVMEMDVPPLQVLIEAKILSVQLTDELDMGVNFALLNSAGKQIVTSGYTGALSSAVGLPSPTNDIIKPGPSITSNTPGLKYGFLSGDASGFITALESIADTSLVASPSLRVLNKQRAQMVIGQRIGYKTISQNGTQSIENVNFLDAGTRLLLRPFISPDGTIRLEVHPERSSATINAVTGLPDLATTEVTTNIMARDGQTIILGGMIAEEATEFVDQVPVLGSLPLVGAAFRNKNERTVRTELIVLLTPRIVCDPEDTVEGTALQLETEERAASFRDSLSPVTRNSQARMHLERAFNDYENGNLYRARQQVEHSLRINKADLDALRLKHQIDQDIRRRREQAWKWPFAKR